MQPPPDASPDWALFLDFDGTLVELRDHPDEVRAPPALGDLLARLAETFDGAVAIVSGRSVAGLEALLAPLRLPLAGVHGLERRDARGVLHRSEAAEAMRPVIDEVDRFVAERPGLHWEDKGGAVAVHFRRAQQRADEVHGFLEGQRARLGDHYHLQAGKAVLELKPANRDKGRVVADFMREAPFAGRVPVFLGDDVTDEHAFAWVGDHGGLGIRIGEPQGATRARYALADVDATLGWLADLPGQVEAARAGTAGRPG